MSPDLEPYSLSKMCTELLICPVCEDRLSKIGKTVQCPKSHSFDISGEGYINLLLDRKRPRILGDTQEMLKSRRLFLDQGHYNPLSDMINKHVHEHLFNNYEPSSPISITDVGCGEGYYIGSLKEYLDRQREAVDTCYFGFDISKEAAKLAARKYKEVQFVVADVKRKILLSDHSVQVLLNIFAPRNPLEFHRILTPGGLLMVVIPGADHLLDLQVGLELLEIQKNKKQLVIEQFTKLFNLKAEHPLEYEIHLNGGELADLIRMTPNYWHISEEKWNDLKAIDTVQTTVSFIVLKFL